MAQHSSLGDFGKAFSRKAQNVEREVAKVLADTVVNIVAAVAPDTPILTGQAQANWLTSIGVPISYYMITGNLEHSAVDSIAMAHAVAAGVKATDTIYISNNVPYIVKLNQGTSLQAPAMFVESAVLRATYRLRGIKINLN